MIIFKEILARVIESEHQIWSDVRDIQKLLQMFHIEFFYCFRLYKMNYLLYAAFF